MTVRTITALRLEVAKIRRLRLWPVAAVLGVVAVAFSLPVSTAQRAALVNVAHDPWPRLLLSVSVATALVSPILTAVLASRLTDVEHTAGGWNLAAAGGLTPGRLCRSKTVVLMIVIVPVAACQVGSRSWLPVGLVPSAHRSRARGPATCSACSRSTWPSAPCTCCWLPGWKTRSSAWGQDSSAPSSPCSACSRRPGWRGCCPGGTGP